MQSSLAKSLGHTIARHRKAQGLTQDSIAEQLGIGVEAVSRIERGVVLPSLDRLAMLADIFQCQVSELLTETSPRCTDQLGYMNNMLGRLDATDRSMVLAMIEMLTNRLCQGRHPDVTPNH
ncbi:helix-turn-helix domain-containing protein [Castellaniella hirudinis]|uniref:helix-turn-helix domain-containing protein n=1 Tax=Castellaniella hirudinis TaxID=1144617 RepID=UPI0039C20FB1